MHNIVMNKIKIAAAGIGASVMGFALTLAAHAQTDYGFASTTDATSSQLGDNLPKVLLIFAGLTALGISVHYIRKWVGRK